MRWTLPLARGRTWAIGPAAAVGILNVTPDSFSDGGGLPTPQAAAEAAARMMAVGAVAVDIGGESTRPGHAPVPAEEELRRVLPAVRAIREALPDAVVLVDTRKAAVADSALAAGADLVNDVSGLADPAMAAVVARHGCSIVLMRSAPCSGDVVAAARSQLADLLRKAEASGIPREATVLDPGLGFGDPPGGDPGANLALLRAGASLGHGRPVLVGASRKRFIGRLSGVEEPAGRVAGSVAAAVLAAEAGAALVRVHDVAETVQALRMAGSPSPAGYASP